MTAETPEAVARELADMFAAHEMKTPFFASTRPYFEKIVASALRARDERAARIVEGDIVEEWYREWPSWGTGNRDPDSELVSLTAALAAAIRARP